MEDEEQGGRERRRNEREGGTRFAENEREGRRTSDCRERAEGRGRGREEGKARKGGGEEGHMKKGKEEPVTQVGVVRERNSYKGCENRVLSITVSFSFPPSCSGRCAMFFCLWCFFWREEDGAGVASLKWTLHVILFLFLEIHIACGYSVSCRFTSTSGSKVTQGES